MPRFYFHTRRDDKVEIDPDGTEFESVDAARADAVLAAREIMAERLVHGEALDGDIFEITNEQGSIVATVPFKSVVQLH